MKDKECCRSGFVKGNYYLIEFGFGSKYAQVTDIYHGREDNIICWRTSFSDVPQKLSFFNRLFVYYYTDAFTETEFKSRII